MIFGLPTWLFAIFVFLLLIIILLVSTLVYMIFFRKVQVIVFGANGMPPEIRKAAKKGNRLFLGRKANLPIYKNYLQQGKKKVYFAVKINEQSYIPYNLVDGKEEILKSDMEIDKIIEQDKSKFQKTLKSLNNQYSKTQKRLEIYNERLEDVSDKLQEAVQKESEGKKIMFVFSYGSTIKALKKQEKQLLKKINVLEERLKKIEELNKSEIGKSDKEKLKKKVFGVLPSLDVDYDWLSVVADAYEEGSKRFEFGLQKFAPFITIAVVAIMCIVGTIMVVKYNTDMTPIEAEAINEFSGSIEACSQYFSEWTKAQQEISRQERANQQSEVDIPK